MTTANANDDSANRTCKLSALIVARDEESRLAACLETVAFADEIVVVLDRSTDRSKDIAEAMGATIVEGAWEVEGDRRNAGIEACTGDWILELDADEHVTPGLAAEIASALPTVDGAYFAIRYRNHIGGRPVIHGWGAYNGVNQKDCLFPKGAKIWGRQRVHPKIELVGKRRLLEGRIDHYVDDNVAAMFDRLNRYTTLAARQAVEDGRAPGIFRSLGRIPTRAWKSYVARKGYREGAIGIALALFSALYPIMIYVKCRTDEHRGEAGRAGETK